MLEVSIHGITKAYNLLGSVAGRVIPWIARMLPMAFTGPVGLAVGAIALIGIAIWKNWDTVRPVLESFGRGFMGLARYVGDVVAKIWTHLQPFITKLAETFGRGIDRLMASLQRIGKVLSPVLDFIMYTVGAIAAVIIGGPLAVAIGHLVIGFNLAVAAIEGILTGL